MLHYRADCDSRNLRVKKKTNHVAPGVAHFYDFRCLNRFETRDRQKRLVLKIEAKISYSHLLTTPPPRKIYGRGAGRCDISVNFTILALQAQTSIFMTERCSVGCQKRTEVKQKGFLTYVRRHLTLTAVKQVQDLPTIIWPPNITRLVWPAL